MSGITNVPSFLKPAYSSKVRSTDSQMGASQVLFTGHSDKETPDSKTPETGKPQSSGSLKSFFRPVGELIHRIRAWASLEYRLSSQYAAVPADNLPGRYDFLEKSLAGSESHREAALEWVLKQLGSLPADAKGQKVRWIMEGLKLPLLESAEYGIQAAKLAQEDQQIPPHVREGLRQLVAKYPANDFIATTSGIPDFHGGTLIVTRVRKPFSEDYLAIEKAVLQELAAGQ